MDKKTASAHVYFFIFRIYLWLTGIAGIMPLTKQLFDLDTLEDAPFIAWFCFGVVFVICILSALFESTYVTPLEEHKHDPIYIRHARTTPAIIAFSFMNHAILPVLSAFCIGNIMANVFNAPNVLTAIVFVIYWAVVQFASNLRNVFVYSQIFPNGRKPFFKDEESNNP